MSIAANKINGIRAAVCTNTYSAKFTRLHNNANVLCLGSRVTGEGLAMEIAEIFVNTRFEGGRHAQRVEKIAKLEKIS
jgi:ribose 5-phosphate isomerase B